MSVRQRLLASSMICGAALAGVSFTQAFAQQEVTEVVVTGSRIPQPNLTSVSPVTVVSSQELKAQGTTRVEDLINNLPQAFADQGGGLSNGATGTATVNLRNLGPQRTLVLIDGRRLVPGDPSYPYADLNNIPAGLVDRVDVVTGGASAVYGSDAVAGVVNFVMKRDFEGVRVDAQYSGYQHDNHTKDSVISALQKRNFPYPTGNVTDGGTTDITVIIGANSPDGKGNATFYAGYRNIEAVLQANRDYSACALQAPKTGFRCAGSGTAANGQFIAFDPAFNTVDLTLDVTGAGNTFRPFTSADVFNYAPYNYYQRPDTRYTAGAFAHYEVNKSFDAYGEFMFMDDHTVAQIAPSGIFGQTINIACNNPMMSAQQVQQVCTNLGYTSSQSVPIAILKRNVEGGGRRDDLRHTDYRIVLGAKGALGDDWNYDIYAQYGTSIYAEEYFNDFSVRRVTNALNVTTNASGQLVCADAAAVAEGCVPYNIFKAGGITSAALNYVQTPGFKEGSTTEQVVSASVTGSLGKWGIKSPWAQDAIGVALGTEYRREALELRVDSEFASGDLAGQGGPTLPVAGSFDIYELFGEARIPLIQDAPLAKNVSMELGYRYSDYSTSGGVSTYKVGGDWSLNDDLRFRASFNRAVRAPNAVELFTPQGLTLDFNNDPCAGATPTATAAQCANTGVSASQYGKIVANPANQYYGMTGGNPNLDPEKADTYSVGLVYTPTGFLHGFTLALDYYHIKVEDVISGVGAQTAIDRCATTGNAYFCGLIHRAPGSGSLFLGTAGYVTDTNLNTGSVETSGLDVDANYRTSFSDMGLGDWGGLAFSLQGSYTFDYAIETLPGDPTYDCVGKYGTVCQGTGTPMTAPTPEWRHKFRTTWSTPWAGVNVSADWRYFGELTLDKGTVGLPDSKLKAQNYMDLSGSFKLKDAYTFHVGVNNVFDKDPPLIGTGELPSTVGNGNTYPQVYDALGRYFFVSVTADF